MMSTLMSFFHQLATVIWIGGAIYINLVLIPSAKKLGPPAQGQIMGLAGVRFTIIAWASIVVVLITGLLRPGANYLLDTSGPDGALLMVKSLLFLGMVVIGILMTFVLTPKMKKLAPAPGEKPPEGLLKVGKQLETLGMVNMVLGILILYVVAKMS
jgi:copper resistance protein D